MTDWHTIDYFSGQLEITAPEARRADAQVEIEFERGALFQLDKKTLLGGRPGTTRPPPGAGGARGWRGAPPPGWAPPRKNRPAT